MLAAAVFLLLLFVLPGNAVYYPANWLQRDPTGQQRAAPTKAPIPWDKPAPFVNYANKSSKAFYGIAHFKTEFSGCTATLIRGKPEDKAILLMAGHCIRKLPINASAIFRKFHDAPKWAVTTVALEEKLWGTISFYDLGVARLNVTYGYLASKGITGYKLADKPIRAGEPVHFVGVVAGGLNESQRFLRRSDCFVRGSSVRMAEGSWIWQSMRRFDCPGVLAGVSGAPVFNSKLEVTGLVITMTIGAVSYKGSLRACYDDVPCELLPTGYTSRINQSYSMDLLPLLPCIVNGVFSPNYTGCPLRQPAILLPERVPIRKLGGIWAVTPRNVSAEVSAISWKAGRLELTDCLAPVGYRRPLGINETFQTSVGYQERRWIVCAAPIIEGKVRADRSNFAMMKTDRTPPVTPPKLSVANNGTGYVIQPIIEVPELVGYYWKKGPAGIDCNKRGDYNRSSSADYVRNGDLPVTVCLIAEDDAGYKTEPKAFRLLKPSLV